MEEDNDKPFDVNALIDELKANEERKSLYEVVKPLGKGKFSTVCVCCAVVNAPLVFLVSVGCVKQVPGTGSR
jgi:hypothetical protein